MTVNIKITEIKKSTAKAILVKAFDGDKFDEIWFPKSQVESVNTTAGCFDVDSPRGHQNPISMDVSKWIAEQKGLIN